MNNMFTDQSGKASTGRAMAVMLIMASIFIGITGFAFGDKEAFDVMMVAGMYLGGGLTGKLVQKQMESK